MQQHATVLHSHVDTWSFEGSTLRPLRVWPVHMLLECSDHKITVTLRQWLQRSVWPLRSQPDTMHQNPRFGGSKVWGLNLQCDIHDLWLLTACSRLEQVTVRTYDWVAIPHVWQPDVWPVETSLNIYTQYLVLYANTLNLWNGGTARPWHSLPLCSQALWYGNWNAP